MLSIGKLAYRTGVKVGTIRYYETAGLLPKAKRGANSRRVYDETDVKRLNFIRRARQLDFNMRTVRTLINLQETSDAPCEMASRLALARLADIEQEIRRLTALRQAVGEMIKLCDNRTVAISRYQ